MNSNGYRQRRGWRTITILLSALLLAGLTLSANPEYRVAATNLEVNGDFESSLAGWTGWEATLSRVQGGHTGTYAARTTHSNTTSSFSINNNKPYTVTSTVKGATYTASGSLRSAFGGHKLCLVVREKSPTGGNLKDTGKCVSGTSSWQSITGLTAVAMNSGDPLLVYAIDYDATKGHYFDLDSVVLTSSATSPTPTPTATATATTTATPAPTATATPAPTATATPTPTPSGLKSWNPKVSCTPVKTTIETIIGSQSNSNGGAIESDGGFVNNLRPLADKDNTAINCAWAFVEIDDVVINNSGKKLLGSGDGDVCIGLVDPYSSRPINMRAIHGEVSYSWYKAGLTNIAGFPTQTTMPAAGTHIDVQGFVVWDPYHVTAAFHWYSGWEIHSIAAWRYHQ